MVSYTSLNSSKYSGEKNNYISESKIKGAFEMIIITMKIKLCIIMVQHRERATIKAVRI